MTGGLVTAAVSVGGLETTGLGVDAAVGEGTAGSCSVQGMLPVVAIAPAESVNVTKAIID